MSLNKKIFERLLPYLPYILLTLVLVVVLFIRIRLLTVPLERDEGEFAYLGQLLLKGIPPFSQAYTMKLPGVSIVYACFMALFGQTPVGIHTGLLIVNGICIWLVYLLARYLFDHDAALFSCTNYALLSLSSSVNGLFAHATHFVVGFALTGLLLLLCSIEKQRISFLFISGLCFGLAVTMKQHAVLLICFAILYYIRRILKSAPFNKRQCLAGSLLFLLGIFVPYALIVLWMASTGSFANFWFWTVQYAREYTSTQPLAHGWNNFIHSFGSIAKLQLPLWLLAGFGSVLCCIKKNWCADRLFLSGYLLFSFFAICPGLVFRSHYFVLLLPVVAILAGAGMNSVRTLLPAHTQVQLTQCTPLLLLVAAITHSLYYEKANFFTRTPLEVSRAVYGVSPFLEALPIAAYIKQNTSPDDKIAVLGSEPEIYFYADRLSATGHIYMYGLMEVQPYAERMQRQLIHEVEQARPKYIILVNIDWSWLQQEGSVKSIFYWGESYVGNLYDMVGIIDIINSTTSNYLWGDNAIDYTPLSKYYIKVFKRKNAV